ncbi:MAG: DUF1700 domain-containing protein [Clostridiales bacterium]|nr:DUF1700 domain-containing protein [Clostridiales bacterium]
MNRNEYLAKLESELGLMSYKDVKDILDEIGEHFTEGVNAGKSEEEIARGLGSPSELAKAYREGGDLPSALRKNDHADAVNSNDKPKDNSAGVMFVVLFNLFVGIPVWVAILFAIITAISIEVGIITGLAALVIGIPAMGNFIVPGICLAITLLMVVIFTLVLIYLVTKYFFVLTGKYIAWNKKLWKEGF